VSIEKQLLGTFGIPGVKGEPANFLVKRPELRKRKI
jgi:hypothetical protein